MEKRQADLHKLQEHTPNLVIEANLGFATDASIGDQEVNQAVEVSRGGWIEAWRKCACGYTSALNEDINQHINQKHKKHSGGYLCPVVSCHKVVKTHNGRLAIDWFKIHMLAHTKEQPFKCAKCKLSFHRKSEQTKHYKMYHGIVAAELHKGLVYPEYAISGSVKVVPSFVSSGGYTLLLENHQTSESVGTDHVSTESSTDNQTRASIQANPTLLIKPASEASVSLPLLQEKNIELSNKQSNSSSTIEGTKSKRELLESSVLISASEGQSSEIQEREKVNLEPIDDHQINNSDNVKEVGSESGNENKKNVEEEFQALFNRMFKRQNSNAQGSSQSLGQENEIVKISNPQEKADVAKSDSALRQSEQDAEEQQFSEPQKHESEQVESQMYLDTSQLPDSLSIDQDQNVSMSKYEAESKRIILDSPELVSSGEWQQYIESQKGESEQVISASQAPFQLPDSLCVDQDQSVNTLNNKPENEERGEQEPDRALSESEQDATFDRSKQEEKLRTFRENLARSHFRNREFGQDSETSTESDQSINDQALDLSKCEKINLESDCAADLNEQKSVSNKRKKDDAQLEEDPEIEINMAISDCSTLEKLLQEDSHQAKKSDDQSGEIGLVQECQEQGRSLAIKGKDLANFNYPVFTSMLEHVSKIHQEKTVNQFNVRRIKYSKCPCGYNAVADEDLNEHIKSNHKGQKGYCCPVVNCLKNLTIGNFKQHAVVHTNENSCGKIPTFDSPAINTSNEVNQDKSAQQKNDHKYYQISNCEIYRKCACGYIVPDSAGEKNLDDHIKTNHKGDSGYICPVVNCKFVSPYNLKEHMPVHTKERPFKCMECGKFFAQKIGWRIHKKRCPFPELGHVDEQFSARAIFDSPAINTSNEVNQDKSAQHKNEQRCDQISALEMYHKCACGYIISGNAGGKNLDDHIRTNHKGVSGYICPICLVNCRGIRNFRLHMTTHTKERPFSCKRCGKFFTTKWYSQNHFCHLN